MTSDPAPATSKGRAARQRILQAAAELVAEKGAAGMSLDDVRARTGASRSQLYHYFENRDDLIHAVIGVISDGVLNHYGEPLDHLDSWAGIDRWFDVLVQDQIDLQARGGCPIGCLAGQLAENDPDARAAIAAGLERYEAHLRNGLTSMKARGWLRKDADPAALATATMASIQGGLLLTQVRRDPQQLRIALNGARNNLRLAAARPLGALRRGGRWPDAAPSRQGPLPPASVTRSLSFRARWGGAIRSPLRLSRGTGGGERIAKRH